MQHSKTQQTKVPGSKVLLMILVAVCLLVYGNTLNNGYALDDVAVVTKNSYVQQGITGIPKLLRTPYLRGFKKPATDTAASNDLYRPLPLVTFAVEKSLFDSSAAISHLANVLLYAVCVCLLFLFLRRLLGTDRTNIAFVAALLFAVHPIHTEVVANVKSRDELLCFLFAFSALLLYCRYAVSGKAWQLAAGASLYFASLLCKESSVTFVAIVPLVFFLYMNDNRRRSTYITIATAVACAGFLLLRYAVLHRYNADHSNIDFIDNPLVGAPGVASRYATAMLVLLHYLKLLVLPYPLISDYTFNTIPFSGFGNVWVLLSVAAYVILVAAAVYRLRKYRRDEVAFGIALYLVTIALFANVFFFVGSVMAERFLFFPSVGFCIVAGAILCRLKGKQVAGIPKLSLAVVVIICVAFGGIAIARNREWKDNETLFTADAAKAPQNARLWYSLGYEKANAQGRIAEGIADIQHSVRIYPDYANAHYTLGSLYLQTRQYDSAAVHAQLAARLSPRNPVILSGLGYVYFVRQQYHETIRLCRQALVYDPGNAAIWDNIAICYQQLKEPDSSATAARKAQQLRDLVR